MKKLLATLLFLSLLTLAGCSEAPGEESPGAENPEVNIPGSEAPEESDSEEVIRDDYFEGIHGTYEWIETINTGNSPGVFEGGSRLIHIFRYTNTTNQAVKPGSAIQNEIVVQHETEIELNTLEFIPTTEQVLDPFFNDQAQFDWHRENPELVKNTSRNIKPGVTIDFAMYSDVHDDRLDSIYIRNAMRSAADKVVYEKRITITTP